MAFVFDRKPNHLETNGNPASATAHWFAHGSTDEAYVNAYALIATPSVVSTIYGTLFRQDLVVRQTAYNAWDVDVPYGTRNNDDGSYTWGYDTTGGSLHISHGKEETGVYPDTGPPQLAAINVDKGKAEGTDIVVPAMKMWVDFNQPTGALTIARARALAGVTGRTNSAPFLTFSPGEVLYLGSRGSDGSNAAQTERHEFAMSPNLSGQTIGDITDIAIKGWEVVWVRWEDREADGSDGKTYGTRVPKFAYTVRVYDAVDLGSILGFS